MDADIFSNFFDGFRGFSVVRGRTNKDTPAIKAEREGVSITVSKTIDRQWWVVADADGQEPLSEMYEHPAVVAMTVIEWLDELED